MTIGRTLLLALLTLVFLSAASLTLLAYLQSRAALRGEIRAGLAVESSNLMQRIDTLMFERLENLHGWSRLELMQEAGVGDVDKRLAELLRQLRNSYGEVYRELLFLDPKQHIIASSDPQRDSASILPLPKGVTVSLPGGAIQVNRPGPCPDARTRCLPLHVPVLNRFTQAPLGQLVGLLDWREIHKILDADSKARQRLALLLGSNGRVITKGGAQTDVLDPTEVLTLPKGDGGTLTQTGLGLGNGHQYLLGFARSQGYQHFPGLGWTVLLAQPTESAFAPIRHLLWALLGLLLLTSLVAILAALLIAHSIANPIRQLAAFTHDFAQDQRLAPPPIRGTREVRELNQAFRRATDNLRQSREHLVQASKLAVVGEMAATMAHEVRTPLGILGSSAQLLGTEQTLSAQGREMVGFILAESRRLNGLVTALLECGRPRPPQLIPLQPSVLLEEVIVLLGSKTQQKSIHLENHCPDAGLTLHGDPEQLKQVFLNLLLNAIQILPEGGRVWVECQARADTLEIRIQDNGPGVAEADREHIFSPFFSHREGGFGLGLSLVQQVLQAHGGDIHLLETSGGADFQITLPLSPPPISL